MTLEVSRRTPKVLFVITLVLFILGLIYECLDYVWNGVVPPNALSLFDLNAENNIPALYSAGLLLTAAVLLGRIALLERHSRDYRHWLGLSILFAYLSFDEAFAIHEDLKYAKAFLDDDHFLYSDAWVFTGFAFVALVGLFYFRFILRLPQKTRTLFLAAGGTYLLGALGMEIIGGYRQFVYGKDFVHALFATIEELLEMMGIVLFIYALLRVIHLHPKLANRDR